ncbi:MAG: sulfatase-like hydrolase/transferase [Planctomycetota bacterium]|nr:sulfatase-like hydrolase/transferase [Planctomycetota bacterium]MEE2796472.1 sulfatase-like hydrolase/transferase [Planctomycetota bacterium]
MRATFFLIIFFNVTYSVADDRPNIIFLMTDDQNVRSLGCYGAPGVKTPNIDALAADGVTFDRHYDTTAICMACRATVMTGLLEYRHGVNFGTGTVGDGQMRKEDWEQSYPMLLHKAGYRTAFAGKFGFTIEDTSKSGRYPEDDFDMWGGGPGQTSFITARNKSMVQYAKNYPHSTRSYGAFGSDFIKESAKKDQPFCLSISFKAPHRPVQPDPLFDDIYAGALFPKPENFGREHGMHFPEQSRRGRQYQRFEEWHYNDAYDEVMAKYYQLIYAVDVAIGMIREAVETAGVKHKTLIIFTSDNGYLCGAHGYGSKVLPYEESSRVPLIIYDPRSEKKAGRCNVATGNIDLAATILDAALGRPNHGNGTSLLKHYVNNNNPRRDRIIPLINVWGPEQVFSLGFVKGEWKYIYWPYTGDGMKATAEMYNLKEDPLELHNRINDNATRDIRVQLEKDYANLIHDWTQQAIDRPHYKKAANLFTPKGM